MLVIRYKKLLLQWSVKQLNVLYHLLVRKELMIVGGVAANKRLSEMLQDVCTRHDSKFFIVPIQYAGDCGSQICWTGLLESKINSGASLENTFVKQSWRLDSVKIHY